MLIRLLFLLGGCVLPSNTPRNTAPPFTPEERQQIVAYWNAPGRYRTAAPPNAIKEGAWQVRLTPQGSTWLLAYKKAVGAGKLPPTAQTVAAAPPDKTAWQKWVQTRLAYDRWLAETAAARANAALRSVEPSLSPAPPLPAPIPDDLLTAVGNPPALASAVTPLLHTVTFEDEEAYSYPDNVLMRPDYAYYRFPQGTVAYGVQLKNMPEDELKSLFADAGMTPSEQRIARAVSILEGGFETVNTYDTGFVSIGFIQFVTLEKGDQSLSEVMAREKADFPEEYRNDFRRFGLDINDAGILTVVDPATGAELTGAPAVLKVIEDKRLTAVYQRAGRHSRPFRIAQIKVAKSHYWPSEDAITITVAGNTVTGKVSDVIHSEAGIATLFDRKVNRGSIAPFAEVLTKVMSDHNVTTLADAARYEREIVAALKYRADFLADTALSQPK